MNRLTPTAYTLRLPAKIKSGKKPLLSDMEEEIYRRFDDARKKGKRVQECDIQRIALQVSKERGIKDFKATRSWLYRYQERHSIVQRSPTHAGKKFSMTEEDIEKEAQFPDMVEEIVTLNNTPPSRMINFDETSGKLQNSHKKTLSPKGVKDVTVIDPNAPQENFTVGLAISADGYKFSGRGDFQG
ncbi:hypothetical protein RvY_10990-2 [Ramazzottius varieornatus]|uniref:HTH CENPB-type domain-containing protein n=1 Tax=Ramazzottius varieornatus TaxID=947166 RepID=A0A1D1VEN4_RAMVA|nr:hypothetical protein RvY_10990-2 [Ramazzottius varieornatus]